MMITDLYPPIAAATVVSAFLFAGFWRGGQIEKATGKDPWWFVPALALYLGPIGLFLYLRHDHPLTGWFDYFGTALMGEAMGVLVVFAILNALFFQRGQALKHRLGAAAGALVLIGLLVAGAFV